jgi:hypothetical protein
LAWGEGLRRSGNVGETLRQSRRVRGLFLVNI